MFFLFRVDIGPQEAGKAYLSRYESTNVAANHAGDPGLRPRCCKERAEQQDEDQPAAAAVRVAGFAGCC